MNLRLARNKLDGYSYFLITLIVINVLPWLAPVLMRAAETPGLGFLRAPAKLIYLIYSFSCHQFAHRSLHVMDYQCAWCSRDVGIWGGILAGALAARSGRVEPLKWYWTIPFIIPIALDGGTQTLDTLENLEGGELVNPGYVSNNLTRFITGAIFGLGISLFISPNLRQVTWTLAKAKMHSHTAKVNPKFLLKIFTILFIIYFAMIQTWALTSTRYLPTNALDSVPKISTGDFFVRREHGACPADSRDLFQIECLTDFN